jgi:hypothetical protein
MPMRFLMLYRPANTRSEKGIPPSPEEVAEMGKFCEEMAKSGALLSTEGCQPSAKGARVRQSGGKVTVTDGPFAETREIIGGFAIVRANSKDEAIELARRFLKVAGDGETEVRQVYDPEDFAAHCARPG